MVLSDGPLSRLGPTAIACLQAGLPGAAAPCLTNRMLAVDLEDVVTEGLLPIVVDLIGRSPGDVDTEARDRIWRAAMAQQLRSLAAEAVTSELFDLLVGARIPFVVVKGLAVARFHPPGWTRTYNDVDVLVEPRQFGRAMRLLLDHGYTYPPTALPPWSWFDEYCREGLNLVGAGNVDLHHHVAPWVFGERLPSVDVIHAASGVQVRGRSIPVASAEHSAVIAALHILNDLWKGRRGLVSWRDVVVLVRHVGIDPVHQAFVECRLEWLLGAILGTLGRHLPGMLGEVGACAPAIPPADAWRMRALGWDRSSPISRHRLAWALRLPLPQAAAFALGSGVPSRRYIRSRHGTYGNYWRQAWQETLSTFAGADHRMEKGQRTDRREDRSAS